MSVKHIWITGVKILDNRWLHIRIRRYYLILTLPMLLYISENIASFQNNGNSSVMAPSVLCECSTRAGINVKPNDILQATK